MKTLFNSTAFLAVVIFCCPNVFADDEPSPDHLRFEEVVPEKAMFFLSISGIDPILAESQSLDLIKLWRAPIIDSFLADAKTIFPELLSVNRNPESAFEQIWRYFKSSDESVSYGLDLGSKKASFLDAIGRIISEEAVQNKLKQNKLTYRGLEISQVHDAEKDRSIFYTTLDSFFLAAVNREHMQSIMDSYIEGDFVLAGDHVFQDLAFPIEEIWRLVRGEAAIAMRIKEGSPEDEAPRHYAFSFETSGSKDTSKAVIDLLKTTRRATLSIRDYEGVEITVLSTDGAESSLSCFCIKNLFVCSTDEFFAHEIIDCALSKTASLASSPAFKGRKCEESASKPTLKLYLNLRTVVRQFNRLIFDRYSILDFLTLLGLKEAGAVTLTSYLDEGISKDLLSIHFPEGDSEIIKILLSSVLPQKAVDLAPSSALMALDFSFDLKRSGVELLELVRKMAPKGSVFFNRFLVLTSSLTGLDLSQDIFSNLGNRACLHLFMPRSGKMVMTPELGLAIELSDSDEFEKVLRDKILPLLKMNWMRIVEFNHNGTSLYRIVLLEQGAIHSPTFAVVNDMLVVTSTTMNMIDYLDWLKNHRLGFRTSKEYENLLENSPDRITSIWVINNKQAIRFLYECTKKLLPSYLESSYLRLDSSRLPSAEDLSAHLSNIMIFGMIDENYLTFEARSSIGFSATLSMAINFIDYLCKEDITEGFGRWLADYFLNDLFFWLPVTFRKPVFERVTMRGEAIIKAIEDYETVHGAPPDRLIELVPKFLSHLPSTGISAFPKFSYTLFTKTDGDAKTELPPWELSVECPNRFQSLNKFIYWPTKNYPEFIYDGRTESIAGWMYIHD